MFTLEAQTDVTAQPLVDELKPPYRPYRKHA